MGGLFSKPPMDLLQQATITLTKSVQAVLISQSKDGFPQPKPAGGYASNWSPECNRKLGTGPLGGSNIGYRLFRHWLHTPGRLQGQSSRGKWPDHQPARQKGGSALRGCHPVEQHLSSAGEAYSGSFRHKPLHPADDDIRTNGILCNAI